MDDFRRHWALDPSVKFLNHGSFGATPRRALEYQQFLRERMERQPVQFFVRDLEPMLDEARVSLGGFLGADPDDLAFITNATMGVNAVLRWLPLRAGDELLTTSHEYNACANALHAVADPVGARVVVADVPFPLASPEEVTEAVLAKVAAHTRLALVDHVTSQTGLVFPIKDIVRELNARGVDTLVDGAHGPGMLPLDLRAIGAAYYTGNLHKWVCAPKGAAFLHVRRDRQGSSRPLSISHGANSPRSDRSRFRLEADWIGTCDPTPWLCVPEVIRFLAELMPGGWEALRAHNYALARKGRDILCAALDTPPPAPDAMLGTLASVPLPDFTLDAPDAAQMFLGDPLQTELWEKHRIEVPVIPWGPFQRIVRISAQLYNSVEEYEALAAALTKIIARQRA